MMHQRHSLRRYLAGYSFLFSLLIVVLLGLFSYLFFVHDTQRLVLGQMTALANVKRENLNRWIDHQLRDFEHLASRLKSSGLISDYVAASGGDTGIAAYAALSETVESHLAFHPEIAELIILGDPGGQVLYSSRPQSIGDYRVMASYYTEASSGVQVQNVYPSPVTLKPTMTFSTGIYRNTGERIGVIAVHLNLDMMDAIVQNEEGLGETGESYLVDRYNTIVSSTRFGTVDYPRGIHSAGVDAAMRGESGSGIYRNHKDQKVLGIYQWLEGRGLALIVEMEVAEAFAAARAQSLFFGAIGFVLIIALGIGAYTIAAHIERPIVELRNAAFQVAKGDLKGEVPVPRIEVLAGLARSFNDMVSRLRGVHGELRMKEEYYRSLIENSSDIVAIVDERGEISYVSPSITRVLGHEPELVGTNLLDLEECEGVSESRAGGLREFLTDLTRIGATPSASAHATRLRVRHADGSWRHIEVVGNNLTWHPAVRGLVLNFRDVSEKLELIEKLNQAQKLEAVGRLAGGIAHDFNNILTAIMGNAELIRLEEGLGETSTGCLSQISESARRATNLTQQLLAYSRKQVLRPQIIDINELTTSVVGILCRLIGEDTTIETELSDDLRPVVIDPSQMEQVIMNLAINARDAMPNGGTIALTTRNVPGDDLPAAYEHADRNGRFVELRVEDSGVGMSEELKTRIFDPFFTTKEVGKGTGLGLSTVLGIVKQSNGHIEVDSAVDHGSAFVVYLPAAEATPEESQSESRMAVRGAGRVLVVEDDDIVRRMMEQTLDRSGYEVICAADAEEALRTYHERTREFDLMITDLVMPGRSGYQLSLDIHSEAPDLMILFMSGYAELQVEPGSVDFESDRFIQKPFTPTDLLRRVAQLLANADGSA